MADNTVDDSSHAGAVDRAVQAITQLISQRRLVPAQQLRQEELAKTIGVTRGPLREALKALSVQGLLRYERNRGYFVTSIGASEFRQLYMLRECGETLLLKSLEWPEEDRLAEIEALHEAMCDPAASVEQVSTLNAEFHLKIFSLSPLQFIRGEVERWYEATAAYRVVQLALVNRDNVTHDHAVLVKALRTRDRDLLLSTMDSHRAASRTHLMSFLSDD